MVEERGRPSSYSEEIAAKILSRLAEGETLSSVCRGDDMPPKSTVLGWVMDDRDGFSDRYARARGLQQDTWADEIIDIADDATNDWMARNGKEDEPSWSLNGEHVQRSRLRSDNRKWLLSRLRPDKYGDRVSTEVTGKGGKDLIPEESADSRTLARAVLGLLREAQVGGESEGGSGE